MREQLPPKLKSNPVVPMDSYDDRPTDKFQTNDPIALAIAKYYYEREWSVKPIIPRGIDDPDQPYFAIITRFEVEKGDYLTIPIGYIPGDLPDSEELRRRRFDYGENRMAGPLVGQGEIWITRAKGRGKWEAERWVLYPPNSGPRWRKAETIAFSTE
jgi:hypothetical protein